MAYDELRAIHHSIFGSPILRGDVVSGYFHLKLLKAYRNYDRKQKEVLMAQQETISELEAQVETLREDNRRYAEIFNSIITNCRSEDIVSRQRSQIAGLLNKIQRLKEANAILREHLKQAQSSES
ncbi:MAG: hypothetical protein NC411_02825 [Bacteroides sp.]|nr:hypothetical protein [Bacteroides sp.]